jgi:hypothetical protein
LAAATFASAPAGTSIKNATALWGLTRNSLQVREKWRNGVKGIFPACSLPLWGKEGVTLKVFPKEWRATGFLMKIKIFRYNGRMFIFYIAMNAAAPKQGAPAAV